MSEEKIVRIESLHADTVRRLLNHYYGGIGRDQSPVAVDVAVGAGGVSVLVRDYSLPDCWVRMPSNVRSFVN